ncbi:MAG: HypC/HybG/HupF family hydrogenase formation chaperone [SAR324 cluster bacterium]|nr:HypC/HybG/HupF family hydrogenase formation chaperone [SAR324 cluster bacterium]
MCLGIPMKVLEMDATDPDLCWVDINGTKRSCFKGLIEELAVGEYVIVHAGVAIEKLVEEEAQSVLELIDHVRNASAMDATIA